MWSGLSDIPPIGEALGQVDIFVITVGQADLWSDVPPLTGIWWQRVLLQVRLTFGQMYPHRATLWPRVVLLKIRLTFGQMSPPK